MSSQTLSISTFKTPASSKSFGNFYVDTTQLKDLAKRLRAGNPAAAKALRVRLREIGEVVAVEARERASYSSRIPASIKVRTRGVSLSVVAGGPNAPDAAPLENKGQGGSFRHPVHGNYDVWVAQKARPFLGPSVQAKSAQIDAMAQGVIDDMLREIGL